MYTGVIESENSCNLSKYLEMPHYFLDSYSTTEQLRIIHKGWVWVGSALNSRKEQHVVSRFASYLTPSHVILRMRRTSHWQSLFTFS